MKVTILAVSSVSKEIRDWIGAHLRGGKDAEQTDDAQRTHALVSALLRELLVNASLSSVPLVLAGGCRLIGSFASLVDGRAAAGAVVSGAAAGAGGRAISPTPTSGGLGAGGEAGGGGGGGRGGGQVGGLGGGEPSLLVLALGYLSAGLQQQASRDRAAISVRMLSASCERAIAGNPRALEALLQVGSSSDGLVCVYAGSPESLSRGCSFWRVCTVGEG